MDDPVIKAGLLLDAAQAQHAFGESLLANLRAHTQGLDAVVRDEIRRTLVEELSAVVVESRRAAESIRSAQRSGWQRQTLGTLAVAGICACLPVAVARWVLPSASEMTALESRRAHLAARVADLERQGGEIQLRSCGEERRLCIRIDRSAPAYGAGADYFVVARP